MIHTYVPTIKLLCVLEKAVPGPQASASRCLSILVCRRRGLGIATIKALELKRKAEATGS